VLSTELRLALAPAATYRRLVAARADATWRAALAPIVYSLLLIGSTVAIMATRRVTLGLVATVAASWSFVLFIQALAALALIASSRRRSVSLARAVELFFRGHAPWSLWMLAVAAVASTGSPRIGIEQVLATAVVPVLWTAIMVAAYCQTVLGTTQDGARLRATVHQAGIIGIILTYLAWAAGGWMRIAEAVTV
jgi:hypothetical protein